MNLKEAGELVLQKGKTVTIKPIRRSKPYLKEGHDGEDIYTGCHKDISLFYNVKTRSYVSPFTEGKETEEQEAFEVLLNQKEGSLNLYTFKTTVPNFWGSFVIKVPKEGVPLNLGNPSDLLMYRIASVDPKVAVDSTKRTIGEKIFEILDDSKEEKIASVLSKKRSKANDYMFRIKKSKKDMYDTLRLLKKQPSMDAPKDWLEGQLLEIVAETTVTRGVAGLDQFLEVMEDATKDTRLFVLDAIAAREIIRDRNGYKLDVSNIFVGKDLPDVVKYFLSVDPKIKETMLLIQDRIK